MYFEVTTLLLSGSFIHALLIAGAVICALASFVFMFITITSGIRWRWILCCLACVALSFTCSLTGFHLNTGYKETLVSDLQKRGITQVEFGDKSNDTFTGRTAADGIIKCQLLDEKKDYKYLVRCEK